MDDDLGKLYKPIGRPSHISTKPLGVSNCISSFERKTGFYMSLSKTSPQPGVRKTLFESKNKENEGATLCKDYLSNKEVTGKTPVAVPSKIKSGPNSDESQGGKRVKPRRSMLGLRSKSVLPSFTKDDNTYTISKPFHSSSPVSNVGLQKATSTPTLNHPFDTEDADASSFFSKGLSDSAWSVFRPTKTSDKKQENYPTETPLSRGGTARNDENKSNGRNDINWNKKEMYSKNTLKSVPIIKPSALAASAEQKRKLQWLSLKFQHNESLSSNSPENERIPTFSTDNKVTCSQTRFVRKSPSKNTDMQNHILGARTRAQLKREKEKFLSDAISPISKETTSFREDYKQNSIDSFSSPKPNNSFNDSNDSYVQNEATIVGTCVKKLPDINEESLSSMTISSKLEGKPEDVDCSDEYLSSEEEPVNSQDFHCIIKLIQDLQKEKDEIDCKFSIFLQEKKKFDEKWDQLSLVLQSNFTNMNKTCKKKLILDKPKHKKVICTKARLSPMSPSACFALSKSSKTDFKNYSDLRAKFTCLKTPVQQSKKSRHFRKSTCYTPNSLSVLVEDQVKDIFGEI